MLSADDLLAGSSAVTELEIPRQLLSGDTDKDRRVTIRPLSVQDLRLINRAARENDDLVAALMVQRSLVEPEMSAQQISGLSAGLLQFLLYQVNRISGILVNQEELSLALRDPLAEASVQLAREFGWTPEQIGEMTMGQVLMYLQMAQNHNPEHLYSN